MNVLSVFGTRFEAIKMAPALVVALRSAPGVNVKVRAVARHRRMLDQVLRLFGIQPAHDLELMKPEQGFADITSNTLLGLHNALKAKRNNLKNLLPENGDVIRVHVLDALVAVNGEVLFPNALALDKALSLHDYIRRSDDPTQNADSACLTIARCDDSCTEAGGEKASPAWAVATGTPPYALAKNFGAAQDRREVAADMERPDSNNFPDGGECQGRFRALEERNEY